MKIGIDLRSLSSGSISGVENYTMNVVENLLSLDKTNEYILFYNAYDNQAPVEYNYINSRFVHSRVPNKILNLQMKLGWSSIEKFTGPIDWFFMPNLNQFKVDDSVKVALTVHDLSPVVAPQFYDAKRRLWHWFLNYEKAFKRANVIFAVSEYTKADLLRIFNIEPNKIKVVYGGVDTKIFRHNIESEALRSLRNRLNLPGEFLLFLNTIEPRKNLKNLVKAFELLNSGAYLVLAGRSGWKNSNIFRLIKRSKKRNKIIYLGYLKEQDKPLLVKMSRALIYPSFYEGFGFQPLEAMAMGVPAVVSQVTALPEVVGDAAILVNPYNINDITVALTEVLKNEPLREILINKGLERAKNFKWKNTADQISMALQSY